MGNRSCSQFIILPFFNSLLLTLFLCSPSHRLHFFMNCSSILSFHGMQPLRNRLLWCGSPTGSQALPENLLQHGICFPQVHRCCQDPPSVFSMPCSFFQGMYTCSTVGLSISCRISALLFSSMGCKGTACLIDVFPPWAAGESILVPGVPLPSPSSLTLLSAELSLIDSASFWQQWTHLGPSWDGLYPVLGHSLASLHRNYLCSLHCLPSKSCHINPIHILMKFFKGLKYL